MPIILQVAVLSLCLGSSLGFLQRSVTKYASIADKTILKASASDDLSGLQTSLFDSINSYLNLKLTDFTSMYEANEWKSGDWSGNTGWWDEKMGSKLTGVSKCSTRGPNDQFSETLNIWMGPGYMVPHLLLTIATDPKTYEGFSITADYVVRGPTPIGTDMTYVELYYGKDVNDWYNNIMAMPNTKHMPPSASFSARLLQSPIHLSVSGLSLEEATIISTDHVNRWMNFMKEAPKVEPRSRGAINGRDDKQRQFYYKAALTDSVSKVGKDFGKTLGICTTGPIAEAYIGGGS
mmetsp:Transcript_10914/g.10548  ORF Transcript_10914/g.10548 Transcript_10914/m.10548 type:complete len:292 (+) Transcript_10914:152-1027(+)|eukprot:CAMPEP_0119033254 /NCGR_PEP_ID=MMETSP1177-20130426/287_1 /TAXON_ID=2985 /ORGANISM="Ochromonas sp, Strain CCMP1899" /LENGTH=291 /DNA_ID=CAMNT_0006989855 /DNA_START=144 /DNA_END=1019 /DNA_ORIENTATION=+